MFNICLNLNSETHSFPASSLFYTQFHWRLESKGQSLHRSLYRAQVSPSQAEGALNTHTRARTHQLDQRSDVQPARFV